PDRDKRDPEFADSPALGELAKDERAKQILEVLLAPMGMNRPILLAPGTPTDKVAALRNAFHEAMNDPGFIANPKRANIEIDEISGDQVAHIVARAYAMPPDAIKAARRR